MLFTLYAVFYMPFFICCSFPAYKDLVGVWRAIRARIYHVHNVPTRVSAHSGSTSSSDVSSLKLAELKLDTHGVLLEHVHL
jgi:hypothetical protein